MPHHARAFSLAMRSFISFFARPYWLPCQYTPLRAVEGKRGNSIAFTAAHGCTGAKCSAPPVMHLHTANATVLLSCHALTCSASKPNTRRQWPECRAARRAPRAAGPAAAAPE